MKFRLLQPNLRVTTIVTLLTGFVVITLLTASAVSLYTSYQFDLSLVKRSQDAIAASLQKGGLAFAVAIQDMDLVQSIVESYVDEEDVHSIEIKNTAGALIYHKSRPSDQVPIKITPRIINLQAGYSGVPLNELNNQAPVVKPVGSIVIYFSTESLEKSVTNQIMFAGGILFAATCVITIVIFQFNQVIMLYLNQSLSTISAIQREAKINWDNKKPPRLYELHVIYDSLKSLSKTIYDRNYSLEISLQEALESKNALERAEHFKDDFIRAIAHDIRTPLGAVLNLLDLIQADIRKSDLSGSAGVMFDACFKSAQVLNDVTSELFDFEQFQSKELIENREVIYLEAFFAQFAGMYQKSFSDRGLALLVKHGVSHLPIRQVSVDKKKLTLIIENIIDNALKFTPAGAVSLSWSTNGNTLNIDIKDSGVGIPDDKLSVIFDRYTQIQSPITTDHEGRGLGLYYVKRLSEVIGAKVSVTSKEGLGTLFSLEVPCYPVESPSAPPTTLSLRQNRPGDQLRVLIIDDDEATCFTLSQMLASHGIESTIENIPELGYQRLIKEAPDLVFIDYHMPGLSGDKLAQKAKEALSQNATFFVCITAESNRSSLDMLDAIFHALFLKPFNPRRLETILSQVSSSKNVTDSIIACLTESG